MRLACPIFAALLLACSGSTSDEPDPSGDEAAVVAADAPQAVDTVETRAGIYPTWTIGPDGRAWRALRRYFGAVGAPKPVFDTGDDSGPIDAVATDGGVATLLFGTAYKSIVQVDLATGSVKKLVDQVLAPSTLVQAIAADATGAYFLGKPYGQDGSQGDLWRVDRSGKLTRLAADMFAPRSTCDPILMVDATSVFEVQSCRDGGSEIVQVPKTGGTPKVIAGVAGNAREAVLLGDTIVYATSREISRIPKTGGAKTLSLTTLMANAIAADGADFLYTDVRTNTELSLQRKQDSGGAPRPVATLTATTPSATLSAEMTLPTKDAIFVALTEVGQTGGGWKHRLVKVAR